MIKRTTLISRLLQQTIMRRGETHHSFCIRFVSIEHNGEFRMDDIVQTDTDPEWYLNYPSHRLKEVTLTPPWKRGYVIQDIAVPKETDVITFQNKTLRATRLTHYRVSLNYVNPADNYSTYITTASGTNNFVVKPDPELSSRLLTIDYEIRSADATTYRESDCQVNVLTDGQQWTTQHPSPHHRPRRNRRIVHPRPVRLPNMSVTPI